MRKYNHFPDSAKAIKINDSKKKKKKKKSEAFIGLCGLGLCV